MNPSSFRKALITAGLVSLAAAFESSCSTSPPAAAPPATASKKLPKIPRSSARPPAKPQAVAAKIVIDDMPDPLADGSEAVSSDGRYTARLSPDFPDPTITITAKESGKQEKLQFFPDVYAMAWTPRSDALVVVDHIAHGRTLHVVTHGKEGWAEAKGADENGIEIVWGANIAPLEITPGEKSVHFRFGSTDWYDGGREKYEDPAFYIQSYDYDLASGRKLHSTRNRVPAAKAEEKEVRTSLLYPPPAIQRLQKQRQ